MLSEFLLKFYEMYDYLTAIATLMFLMPKYLLILLVDMIKLLFRIFYFQQYFYVNISKWLLKLVAIPSKFRNYCRGVA